MKKKSVFLTLVFIFWLCCYGFSDLYDEEMIFSVKDGFSADIGFASWSMDDVIGKPFYEGNVLITGCQFKIPKGLLKGVFVKISSNFSIDGGSSGSDQGQGFHLRTRYEIGFERVFGVVLLNSSIYQTSLWKGKFYGIRVGIELAKNNFIRPFILAEKLIPSGDGEIIAGDNLYAPPWVINHCLLYNAGIKGMVNIGKLLNHYKISTLGHSCAFGTERSLVSALQGELIVNIYSLRSSNNPKKQVLTISPRIFGLVSLSSESLVESFLGFEMKVSLEVPFFK